MAKVFIDDIREPYFENAVVLRSYSKVIEWFENNGIPEFISFDHDLGEDLSGYDIAKWLVDFDLKTGSMPKNFTFKVHSANPVGAENIYHLLNNYLKWRD